MADGRTGKELGVELNKLWYAGKKSIPTVSEDYRDAYESVVRSGDNALSAFRRPDQFGGSEGAYRAWEGLRKNLEGILHETQKSLALTGEALCLCATRYAESDQAAKDELDRLRREDLSY